MILKPYHCLYIVYYFFQYHLYTNSSYKKQNNPPQKRKKFYEDNKMRHPARNKLEAIDNDEDGEMCSEVSEVKEAVI